MKKSIIILILIFSFTLLATINWGTNLFEAEQISRKTGKPVFLLFSRKNCPACKRLNKKIKKGLLSPLSDKFIFVKISTLDKKLKKKITDYLGIEVKYVPTPFVIDFFNNSKNLHEVKFDEILSDIKKHYLNFAKTCNSQDSLKVLNTIENISSK